MPDKYDILWEELKKEKVCDGEKSKISALVKFIKDNPLLLPELLTPLKILNTQNESDLGNLQSIKDLHKRFDFKMDNTYIYYTHTDTSKPVGESWRNFIKAINRHTTVTGNIEIKDPSVTKVEGAVTIENADKIEQLWNKIQKLEKNGEQKYIQNTQDAKDKDIIIFNNIIRYAKHNVTEELPRELLKECEIQKPLVYGEDISFTDKNCKGQDLIRKLKNIIKQEKISRLNHKYVIEHANWNEFIKELKTFSNKLNVTGEVKILDKYDILWNNIQGNNKDPQQIKFKDVVKAVSTLSDDEKQLIKNLENCTISRSSASSNCKIKKLIDRLIEKKKIIKRNIVLGDYYIEKDNWKDFIDSINNDVVIWNEITTYSKTLTPSIQNILMFFFYTDTDKYDKSIKDKLEQDLKPIDSIPIFFKTEGFMKNITEKKDDELGTPENMFLKVLKDTFNNTYVVGDKIIMNALMTKINWDKLLDNIKKLNVISIRGDVTIKDPSIINVSGKIRCKPIINRKEYIKINEILLHFNMFKDILMQNNYKIYNLTHISYQNETTPFFYKFDTTKLKKDLKKNSNYFIYINHIKIFEEYDYINLILFISDTNRKLLDKFVYGVEIKKNFVEIKKNFNDYSAKIGSLSYCKNDYAYYVLDQEKFPTFILNKDDELKKITDIYNDYDGEYEEYNLNTVLTKVVLGNILDNSDESYNFLVDDDDDLNFKQDENTERIDKFSKYRILKNIDDNIENTKKIVEKYNDNDLVDMLIQYHIHNRSDDEFEYIKIIPHNKKKVLKLLLDKIL